jgi:uncharacterized protein DUF6680
MMPVEWWVVVATLIGPVVAVQTQKWVERASERSRRRQQIFVALMANRATRLNDDYVRALNLIDLEFAPKRMGGAADRQVISAWRSLFGELTNAPPDDNEDLAIARAWNFRIGDQLVELLSAMSASLGYRFTREELRRGIYYPKGRADIEQVQTEIMHGLSALLKGAAALPMAIKEFPVDREAAEAQLEMLRKTASAYDGGALRVVQVKMAPKKG